MSGVGGLPPWESSGTWDDDDAEAYSREYGPEYYMFQDALSKSSEPGEVIMTEGAARAIEHGEHVSSVQLTLSPEKITLEAPHPVWFHVCEALALSARSCASCKDLLEVVQRAMFEL